MEAFSPQQTGRGHADPDTAAGVRDVRTLTGVEMDRRIRSGWDVWCDLVDDLVGTAGMLPSRELAGRLVGFFEDGYWLAEEARVEALRRELTTQGLLRCRMTGRSRGIQ